MMEKVTQMIAMLIKAWKTENVFCLLYTSDAADE